MTHWSLDPILGSYAVVVATAAVLFLLLLIGPAFGSLTRFRRGVLIGLRAALVLLVLVAMLRPTRVSTTTKPQTATLILLFDQSRSMQLPNESGSRSRWDAQRETLAGVQAVLAELSKRIEVKLYSYDGSLHPVELVNGRITFPEKPDGGETDIGTGLGEAVRREIGKRLLGVCLLGDGVQTAFDPKIEVQEAARELARLGYPLYTVAFGPTGDAAQARDVAVENMQDQYTVFVKNEMVVRGLVRVRGYVNKEIPVALTLENAAGEKQVLGPKKIVAREDGQQLDVEFSYTPQQPGQYKLTLHAAEQSGELVTKNNQLSAFLTVLDGGLKVLYLEGQLRSEFKFLKNSLDKSPDIDLDVQWIDHKSRERWPVDLAAALKDPKYDAFIIGDLDSAALGKANLELLAQAVERGKGLITLGGYHSFAPGGYHSTIFADVLPIKMDKLERQDFDKPILQKLHLPEPVVMVPARDHPIMRLSAGEENTRAWNSLPPLIGANKFSGVKDAAGVQVLAQTPRGAPLLVAGEYGRGRVLAFAGDSTWRWWTFGRQAEHRRFWRQVVLWLVRRDDLTQNDVWVKLSQRRFPPGSKVTFATGAKTPAGDPIRDATFQAELTLPDGKRETLRLSAEGDQWNGAIEAAKQPGDYRIEITATSDGKKLGTARGEFMVFDQDAELANAAADHDQLARLANLTKEFGGKPVAPEQFAALLQELTSRPGQFQINVQTKWQLADTSLDAWLFLTLLVAVLGGEWFLRKKWGLV